MSKLAARFRTRRQAARRARAIQQALSHTSYSPTLRDEILTITNRPF